MSTLLKGDRRRKDPCSGVLLPILQSSRAWFRTPLRRQNQTKYHGTCRRVVVEGWEHCVSLDRAMSPDFRGRREEPRLASASSSRSFQR